MIFGSIDAAVENRWDAARGRARTTVGTVDQRVRQIRRSFLREVTVLGTLSGGVAAAPGFGLITKSATVFAELGWLTTRAADLILTIGAVYGHEGASAEERRAWILAILAYGNGAGAGFAELASGSGKRVGVKATRRISSQALRRFNRVMGRTLIAKYGSKRGVIALGQFLPFGFGAAVGAGGNYVVVRTIARQADNFFRHLPYSEVTDEP